MKNIYTVLTLVLTLIMLLVPLFAVDNPNTSSNSGEKISQSSKEKSGTEKTGDVFRIYKNDEKKTVQIPADEYIVGVVASEVSPENAHEALKAQALAAYTFAYRKRVQNTSAEYDLTTDSSLDQGYLDENGRKQKWGEKFSQYEEKIKSAANAVKGKIIAYNGEAILAAYHGISPGKTESALNVWGTDYPYLTACQSVGDLLAPEYLSEVTVTVNEFEEKIKALGITPSSEPQKYIGNLKKSESGTVLELEICGTKSNGKTVRSAFGLRSAAFDVTFGDGKFTFTVQGYGHGVGMSQFGANYMALQGSDYKEIILAYYKGVEIIDV